MKNWKTYTGSIHKLRSSSEIFVLSECGDTFQAEYGGEKTTEEVTCKKCLRVLAAKESRELVDA